MQRDFPHYWKTCSCNDIEREITIESNYHHNVAYYNNVSEIQLDNNLLDIFRKT